MHLHKKISQNFLHQQFQNKKLLMHSSGFNELCKEDDKEETNVLLVAVELYRAEGNNIEKGYLFKSSAS